MMPHDAATQRPGWAMWRKICRRTLSMLDTEDEEGEFLVNGSLGILPLALDGETTGPVGSPRDDEVGQSWGAVDGRTDEALANHVARRSLVEINQA